MVLRNALYRTQNINSINVMSIAYLHIISVITPDRPAKYHSNFEFIIDASKMNVEG